MNKISMYTLSTCPWCRKTKKFFRDKGISFDFIDYDLANEHVLVGQVVIYEIERYALVPEKFFRLAAPRAGA